MQTDKNIFRLLELYPFNVCFSGDIKVEISNKKGEMISKLPGSRQSKLLIELKVVWHGMSPNYGYICKLTHIIRLLVETP